MRTFVHADIGTGDKQASLALATALAPLLPRLTTPGAILVADQPMPLPGWTRNCCRRASRRDGSGFTGGRRRPERGTLRLSPLAGRSRVRGPTITLAQCVPPLGLTPYAKHVTYAVTWLPTGKITLKETYGNLYQGQEAQSSP